jgi:hypothetical protein
VILTNWSELPRRVTIRQLSALTRHRPFVSRRGGQRSCEVNPRVGFLGRRRGGLGHRYQAGLAGAAHDVVRAEQALGDGEIDLDVPLASEVTLCMPVRLHSPGPVAVPFAAYSLTTSDSDGEKPDACSCTCTCWPVLSPVAGVTVTFWCPLGAIADGLGVAGAVVAVGGVLVGLRVSGAELLPHPEASTTSTVAATQRRGKWPAPPTGSSGCATAGWTARPGPPDPGEAVLLSVQAGGTAVAGDQPHPGSLQPPG